MINDNDLKAAADRYARHKAAILQSHTYRNSPYWDVKLQQWKNDFQYLENKDCRFLADAYLQHLADDEGRDAELKAAIVKLSGIVETTGCDSGVVKLSNNGPCHYEIRENGKAVNVYDHEYFSPLGDALIDLHKTLLAALGEVAEASGE